MTIILVRADDLDADMLLCHQVIEPASLREKAVSYWKMLVRCSVIELEAPVGDDGGRRPGGDVWFRGSRISLLCWDSLYSNTSLLSRRSRMNTVDLMCLIRSCKV